jgi:hypothetical protein
MVLLRPQAKAEVQKQSEKHQSKTKNWSAWGRWSQNEAEGEVGNLAFVGYLSVQYPT